jgi:glycosyltransferase involved in cell wall biosynthesis
MVMTNFVIQKPRFYLYNLLFERTLKSYGVRLHYVPPGVFSILESVDTYRAIWAISEFSQKWIWRYWKRHSEIITPPVNVEDFRSGEKRKAILSVGRFFTGSHNKKHLEMITAFKELYNRSTQPVNLSTKQASPVDQVEIRHWELHLAGGSTPGVEQQAYLEKIHQAAAGYPIFIHIDIPFPELVKLYSQSAIYWHAGGFGEDEEREPIKFEHFGITTVEAMASGCVPVVIGKGGQPEIVQHTVNGFLWQTLDELKQYTLMLMADPALRQRLSTAAIEHSRKYDRSSFNTQLDKLLAQIGVV